MIDYPDRGATYHVLDIFHGERERGRKVWSVEYAQVLLKDDYERLLRAAGFDHLDFYGTHGFAAYHKETSDRLIVVAQK